MLIAVVTGQPAIPFKQSLITLSHFQEVRQFARHSTIAAIPEAERMIVLPDLLISALVSASSARIIHTSGSGQMAG